MRALLISFFILTVFGTALPAQTPAQAREAIGIPEVQELIMVLFALAEPEGTPSGLIDHGTAYYREVMTAFAPYKGTKVVRRVRRKMKKRSYHLRMDACNYTFDDRHRLVRDPQYDHFSWGKKDVLRPLTPALEDWAKQTGFRRFYQDHRAYYDSLKALMERQSPIAPQRDWLNRHFPSSYQDIQIFFSPLSYSRHSTNSFFAQRYQKVLVFVSGPFEAGDERYSEALKEGLISRMVFTEIDHNYVNPLSDQFLPDIQKAFQRRAFWATPGLADHYSSAYDVFNEYMTWGAFLLYAKSHFSEDIYAQINQSVVSQMEQRRGFIRFGDFSRQLFAVYKRDIQMETVYPLMLRWASVQQNAVAE